MLTAESFEARKKDFLAYKDTLVKEPTGESVKKEYCIGCYNASDWKFVHEELKKDGSLEDNIPSASCDVINDCIHSSTRGIYLLTDVEAASLRNHPKVVYVNINVNAYPGTYLQNPDDIVEHNGGKDIKIGDDKRPVSIIPKEQQVLHDFASGEVLVDEFGVPLLAEKDAIFVPDATADRSTSVVFSDLDTTSDRNIFETISLTQAVYGDYDIPIGTSIKNLDVGNPTNTGIATVKTQGGVGIATVGIGSMKILKRDGKIITHDQWPYLDVRSVEEQGVTDSSGNEIPRNTNKIYLPDYVGITSILKVDNSDSDPITNKKFLVTGKYLEGNVRIVNVAYNSRLTLAKSHTANDEILGLTSTIPISIGANKVVTVTLNNHGFVTGDLVHIKTQKESGGIITLNRNYTKSYKVTKVSDSVFTFVHDYSASLNNTTGRVFIKTSADNKFVSDSFKLETTNESSGVASPKKIKRYLNSVRHKRDVEGGASGSSDYIPSNPTQTLLNRGSWQLRRHQNKVDPWKGQDPSTIKVNKAAQFATGKDIDIIVCDQDMWFGHIEFQNPDGISNIQTYDNSTSAETVAPVNYLGGNALRDGFSATATSATNGTCDLLDLVLEAPYYLDPEFFEASPSTRLATRWDGTTVPDESVARAWWSTNSTSNRSAKFVSSSNGGTASGVNDFGTISIPSGYTRANSNGTAAAYQTGTGYHGTPCASQAYGRQYGWAYNANKWFLNLIGTNGIGVENGFDIQKVFHQIKPTNSEYSNKNPTISSNSWAFRFSFNTGGGYYYYRQGTTGSGGVQFSSWDFDGNTDGDTGVAPRFMTNFHETEIRVEPQSGSMLTAGNELVAAGVIFVCSAGNSRQKIVDGSHPDFNNYISNGNNTALSSSTASDPATGVVYAKTINRPGMPGAIGKSGSGSSTVYNTIQVGALDDDHHITAELTSGGAGYTQSDGQYSASPSGGSGSGLIVKLVIASGIVTEIVIFEPGSGYTVGDVLTIEGGATTNATITITSVNEKEQIANYSNMGNAVDLYAAADSTLAASDDNFSTRRNRYDAYYDVTTTSGGITSIIQSVESEDMVFRGTSAACPIAAGLIATKLENNRTWTKTEIKNWLTSDVGEQNADDFHFGTEVVGANDAGWAADYNNLHGGSPTVIWDTQAGSSSLPYFILNEQEYKPINAFNPEDNTPASGSFADTFVTGDKHRVFVNNARIVQNHDYSVGVGSVHLSHITDNDGKNLITSGKFVYGKRLGLEASGTEKWDDLTISADKGVFFRDGLETYYTIDKKVNNVKISKVESTPVKSNVVLKVAEQFPETSEVSTTLLGVSRAETQLSLFSNVSSYGLESKDWEVLEHRSVITLREWAERINEIYGERTRGEIREETQESAIQLYLFPCPNTFPFGPKFEKNNLYQSDRFEDYAEFIEMGNVLYNHYNSKNESEYGGGTQKQKWLRRFLNPIIAAPTTGAKRDVEYFVELKQAFAAIDNWTETYRDIRLGSLISPISGDPSPIGFTEVNTILGLAPLTYASDNTRPGYSDSARRYLLLQSRRVFRYQPGRISGFTFGVRVAREQNAGFKLEWGIFNKTDHYVFQLDKGFLKIVRRSQVPLPEYIVESTGALTTQEFVKTPDPQDSYESEENPTGDDYKLHELVIPQDNFNGDSLDGNGPSGHTVKPENITMYKIEFGWYGAIGARFYAYIPAGNGEARWVVLHTLVIENQIGKPCLVDPYFRFRYVANITKSTDIRTPQFVYKYGASYYIDGGDEGTTSQNSIKTKSDSGRAGVGLQGTTAILGIRPKDEIYNSLGIGIKNKKITIPTQLNMTTNALTKVRVGVCTGCPGWAHVHTQGFRRNGTDNSSFLGRQLPIKITADNTIEPFYPEGGTAVYFKKEDIGAKIVAPSIYNCYIVEVMDEDGNRGSLNQTPDAGYNNYTKATIHGFLGHDRFVKGGADGDTGRAFFGELAKDRSVSPPVNVLLPNNPITDPSDPNYNVYQSEASKPDAQPVRLSNYDGLAISDYKLTGSEIDILFTVPRGTREGGIDPTWGYSHWGDVMVGITDVQPISDGTLSGVEFDIDWQEEEDGSAGTGNTSRLPNSKILFSEHTHAWASSDIDGADSREAWPVWQFRTRLGLSHQVPPLVGISSGRCGRVKIRVGDPETIQNITLVNKNPKTDVQEGKFFLTSPSGGLTAIDSEAYNGGQVAYTVGTDPSIIKENNVVFVGSVDQTDPNPKGEVTEFIEISDTLSNVDVNGSLNLAIRKVNISTEFLKQNNNSTKIFKFDVFPLFPVIKLKDYGEINNVSIREVVGETQVTVSPRFFVNGCEINTYGGLVTLPTNTTSTPPTNFRSVSDLSGAEFDNQNKCQIRDFVQKDVFYIGRDQTQSIDMSKVFSQDKEVIAADQNNVEATFVIANNIDSDNSIDPTVQASLNFKEQ